MLLLRSVFVPESSKSVPEDAGVRAHTNYVIHNPSGIQPKSLSDLGAAGTSGKSDTECHVCGIPGIVVLSLQNGANLCGMRSDQ